MASEDEADEDKTYLDDCDHPRDMRDTTMAHGGGTMYVCKKCNHIVGEPDDLR